MTLELLQMPVRAKGEGTYDFVSRRDSVRINNLELQVQELQKIVLKKGKKK